MKKWKYLKGDESDFVGDNESLLVVKSQTNGAIYRLGLTYGGRDKDIEKVGDTVIAYREPVEGDEQDLNDCIGAPEARIKSGELHVDGKWRSASIGDGDIPALIAERGSRYGKFKDGADIMQSLKDVRAKLMDGMTWRRARKKRWK